MKHKKTVLAVLSLALALLMALSSVGNMAPTQVMAKESDEIREQLDEVKSERAEVQASMKALNKDIDNNKSEIEKMAAEKAVIDQEIGLLSQEILLINQEIATYGLLIADKQDELDAAQKKLDDLTAKNKERIRTMEEDGNLSYWSVLFRANDFADLLDRLNMIEEIASADRRRLEEMRVARQTVKTAQDELNEEKAAVELVKLELEEKQTLLAQKRVEADKKLIQLNSRNEEFLEMLEKAEAAEGELLKEIAQLEKEYNAAKKEEDEATRPIWGPVSGGATTGTKPPASVTNGLTWYMPCSYIALTSPWGWRIHPVYGYPRYHDGVDLANYQGTPIYATRAGTVTIATYSDSAGYYVSVNHGDGFSSQYMHMTHYVVVPGQKVEGGQLLGYMGSTGVSTGPHLHFAIWYNGSSVNPADYLNFK